MAAGLPGAVRLLPAPLGGSVEAPPSKSYTHRALLASLLAGGGVVERPLDSLDTRATAGAVEALGGRVEWLPGRVVVEAPGGLSWGCCIDAGESGTTARLVTGVAALLDKPVTVHGRGRLHRRPVLPLLRSLSLLGVSSVSSGPGGCCPPHTVRGPARPGATVVDAGASSQFLSAVLYTGAGLGDWVEARVAALESRPYVDITVRVLEAYGAAVEREGYRVFRVRGPLRPTVYRVPGDWSSAAPLLAAAVASGGEARVEGLDPGDPQPDRAVVGILESMGARCLHGGGWVACGGGGPGALSGFEACIRDSPDLAPVLAALAAVACGVSRICCAERLRLKESDRVEAALYLAGSVGAEAWLEEEPGRGLCIVVRGLCRRPRCPRGGLSGRGDHRVAMAAAVLALASGEPCVVREADVVAKSFPGFWDALRQLGAGVEPVEV